MSNQLRDAPTEQWVNSLRERYPVERTVDEALTRKLSRRTDEAMTATNVSDLHQLLQAFLTKHIDGDFEIRNLAPLTGGASKEQFSFEIDWICNGEHRKGERMVLRREPGESVVESDRLREFQLLSAVKDIVPVPTAYWIDETGDDLIRPSMICGFVGGVQKPVTSKANVTGVGIEFDRYHRGVIGPQVIDYLARIHNFNGDGADVSAFEIPKAGTTEDVDWQINWWARVWQEDMQEAVPLITAAEQWLRANRQPLDVVSLVHSDYRTGNYLFNPETKKITAILDWELGYFGDRHYDLAWLLLPAFVRPGEQGEPLYASIFDRDQFIEDYQRVSGLTVDENRLRYYTVFALWKGSIMILGSALRAAKGLKTHQDILMTWFGGLGYPFLESLRQAMVTVVK